MNCCKRRAKPFPPAAAALHLTTGPRTGLAIGQLPGHQASEDLRGQHVDPAISLHQPRRLITLAPSLDGHQHLETLVAAYCPLPEDGPASSVCGDVVVMRGGMEALQRGLSMVNPLIPPELPCWVWWNGPSMRPQMCSKASARRRGG